MGRGRVLVIDEDRAEREDYKHTLAEAGYVVTESSREEAVRRVGLAPAMSSVRGGTDGSRLSHMGLPCPNIFTGGHAFHSPLEWISSQDMEKAVETIVELAKVWEERAG